MRVLGSAHESRFMTFVSSLTSNHDCRSMPVQGGSPQELIALVIVRVRQLSVNIYTTVY